MLRRAPVVHGNFISAVPLIHDPEPNVPHSLYLMSMANSIDDAQVA